MTVVGNSQYEIRSVLFPTKVFDVTGESKKVYEHLIVYDSHGKLNQRWLIHQLPNSLFCKIESAYSKMVMEVEGGVDQDGVGVVQNIDYNNLSQMWAL